jgi:hypothetical protein
LSSRSIRQVIYSLRLSAAGIRFLNYLTPAEDLGLAYALLTVLPDLIRVITFRICEMQPGWILSVLRDLWCSYTGLKKDPVTDPVFRFTNHLSEFKLYEASSESSLLFIRPVFP